MLVVPIAALALYLALRPPEQAQVSADALPLVAGAHRANVFVDCSKVNDVTYDPHNPCQTFVLLRSDRAGSSEELLRAEAARLRRAGWRHPAQPVSVDWDGTPGPVSLAESWAAPNHAACAFVVTDERGVAAEGHALLPFDSADDPKGLLTFYLRARAQRGTVAVWARLQPVVGSC